MKLNVTYEDGEVTEIKRMRKKLQLNYITDTQSSYQKSTAKYTMDGSTAVLETVSGKWTADELTELDTAVGDLPFVQAVDS